MESAWITRSNYTKTRLHFEESALYNIQYFLIIPKKDLTLTLVTESKEPLLGLSYWGFSLPCWSGDAR